MSTNKLFVPPLVLANRLGLAESWLRSEAKAGRIPHLRVGHRLMFIPAEVERSLIERNRAGVDEIMSGAGRGAAICRR